ncbi:DUF4166 domain-containing protein [Shimia abyssi]|uniref:Uncharacterized protein DUF4166 n=1 Tax=Shimia abyssi TaxID=1662395 RepID=A0A2P8FE11_9RHOB|nr:DUF4166 domain-containing protein [Shimia abyssi]PSL19951.1 uncharacterized protein DUF4166 [Shimia abyssi]
MTVTMFERILGPTFHALPDPLRAAHSTRKQSLWHGHATITRGPGALPNLIATLFRFPKPATDLPVTVSKTVTSRGETWQRTFGNTTLRSHLSATNRGLTERLGLLTFSINLDFRDNALHWPVTHAHLGPIRLPHWLLPRSEAREFAQNDQFHFDIALFAPITDALIVHYRGALTPYNIS